MKMGEKNVDDLTNWYIKNRDKYKNLALKVESIIKEVLDASGVSYYTITSRAKDIDSFISKASKEKYRNPIEEIKDMAGIRVITFVKNEVYQCCDLIKPLFVIDQNNSVDKGKELGDDKVGYRSVHYVASLTEERLNLPEYKIFKDMYFEIQIRTILEHAWADISHDRNYKFEGVLPPDNDIQRRFSLAAATLELVDREFDSIAREIGKYENEIIERAEKGDLDIDINTTSLRNYLSNKFSQYIIDDSIKPTFNKVNRRIIKELKIMGINKLNELERIIDNNDLCKYIIRPTNFSGVLRQILMNYNIDLYFSKAWNRNWNGIDIESINQLEKSGIDIKKYVKKYKLDVYDDRDIVYFDDPDDEEMDF